MLSQNLSGNTNTKSGALWLVGIMLGLVAGGLVLGGFANPDTIGRVYAVEVLVILFCLDLITRFYTDLGALDALALGVARATRGDPRRIVWGVGMLMFFISCVLNNLAAIFAAAPIFLLILQQLGAGRKATNLMLALMLVNTNLGGAASPIGDFPAIILMASGAISFKSYLLLAFPLCLATAALFTGIAAWFVPRLWSQTAADMQIYGRFAVEALAQRMQYAQPDRARLALLTLNFLAMIVAWSVVSPTDWPFHWTAIAGAAGACFVVGWRQTTRTFATYDITTMIVMSITLAGAAIATATGALDALAALLAANIENPTALLFVVMLTGTVAAALFQAGPAAAAMLPVFAILAGGPLVDYGDWVYLAYAGSICAGSSMFVFSATSGPALLGEVKKASVQWGIAEYLRFGIAAAVIQFAVLSGWIGMAIFGNAWWIYVLVVGSVAIAFLHGSFSGIRRLLPHREPT